MFILINIDFLNNINVAYFYLKNVLVRGNTDCNNPIILTFTLKLGAHRITYDTSFNIRK